LDQRLEEHFVDLSQAQHPHLGAKGVEHPCVGHRVAMPQPGKVAPRALFGQQSAKQVRRMHRRQQGQQMHPPQLGGAVLPTRATRWTDAPPLVDEVIGNVWLQQMEQLVAAGHRKTVHARTDYPFEHAASALC
jgi:hypothetical protein